VPPDAARINSGMRYKCSCLIKPFAMYTNERAASTPRSMAADVAMKMCFSRLKEVRVIPRSAPPVPTRPARKPAIDPPPIALNGVGFKEKSFFTNRKRLRKIRKIPSAILSMRVFTIGVISAPSMTNSMEGKPIVKNNRRFIEVRNNAILEILLMRWKTTVMPRTE